MPPKLEIRTPGLQYHPLSEIFWSRVEPGDQPGCLIWTNPRQSGAWSMGYGQLRPHGRSAIWAHRLSYEINIGPIPLGLCVLHKCDNPPCVNPRHLFLGTRADNMRDCWAKGRFKLHPENLHRKYYLRRDPDGKWRYRAIRNR